MVLPNGTSGPAALYYTTSACWHFVKMLVTRQKLDMPKITINGKIQVYLTIN